MLGKLMRHVEQKEEICFEFEITNIDVTQPILRHRLLAVRWARHGKGGLTKTSVADASGKATFDPPDGLKFKATLYRNKEKKHRIDPKEIKLSVEEVVKAGKSQPLGSVKFDLAHYANHDQSATKSTCQVVLDGGIAAGAEMLFAIRSKGAGGAEETDSQMCEMPPCPSLEQPPQPSPSQTNVLFRCGGG